jgi:glycosyltransferase involved in cell wall biosynthesis
VAPARYEPFGLAALEAASRGCALVLGDIPSLREVWGEAALYVHPEEEAALATTLMRLIVDTNLRAEMANRALRRSRAYGLDEQVARYLSLYRSVALAPARQGVDQPCA